MIQKLFSFNQYFDTYIFLKSVLYGPLWYRHTNNLNTGNMQTKEVDMYIKN